VTDHAYAACRNVLDFAAQRAEARVVVCAQGVWFSVRPAGSAGADPPDLDQPRGLGPRRESSLSGRVRLDRNRSLTIPSMRLLRLSAQLYNRSEDYHMLAEALKELL
jgi:selenocysteine lyase/cysteine desulfurase